MGIGSMIQGWRLYVTVDPSVQRLMYDYDLSDEPQKLEVRERTAAGGMVYYEIRPDKLTIGK